MICNERDFKFMMRVNLFVTKDRIFLTVMNMTLPVMRVSFASHTCVETKKSSKNILIN